jgi:disulfide bond formation protein DsbB
MIAAADRMLLRWPLFALLASAAMLAIAHGFESIGGFSPCNLCLRAREVYWAIIAVSAGILVLRRFSESRSLRPWGDGLLGLMFLFGAGLAFFHAGVEWKWWPGPASCAAGGGAATTADLLAALGGEKIRPPTCDRAAWVFAGLSMAGWNGVASLLLAAASGLAASRSAKAS